MIVEVVEDPSPATAEWDELATRCNAPPWLRPGWVMAWKRAFAPSTPLLLLCARSVGGTLEAALPLLASGRSVATASNSETPFSGLLAANDESASSIASELFARGDRRITLWPVERDGMASSVCSRVARERRYSSVTRAIGRSPYVLLEQGWDEYQRSVGRKVFSEIRRRRRRLSSRGELTVEVVDGLTNLSDLLDDAFRIEAAGWKGRQGTAMARRPEAREFYGRMCAWAATAGILRLAFLRLDGRAIAFDLSIEDAGVHYLLKTSYDPELRTFGPGMMLRSDMLERAFASGLERYELLGTDEPWKHAWASYFRDQLLVRFFAPSITGNVDRFVHAVVKPAGVRVLERLGRPRY